MDIEILKERDMPLLSRKRYTLQATFKGPTPTRAEILAAVSKKVKSEPGLTVVKHIYNKFGIEKAKVIAHAYTKKEDMEKYENKVLLEKHMEKKKEESKDKKQEAPKAPATEETKKEDKPKKEAEKEDKPKKE